MPYITDNGYGFEGFSFTKLTNWVAGTASAIASGNKAAIGAQIQAAIPGAPAARTPVASPSGGVPTKPQQPGFFSPGGFVEQNQTILLLAAAGLAAFLVLGRKGRK